MLHLAPIKGYKPLVACDTKIANMLNNYNACDVFLIDFTRAFDRVPHSVVQQKMKLLGIGDQRYDWLTDFLRCRSQCVLHGDVKSSFSQVVLGLIQG